MTPEELKAIKAYLEYTKKVLIVSGEKTDTIEKLIARIEEELLHE